MAEAKDVKISIGGKTITLSGDVSEEYSSRLAEYLNGKRKSFHDDSSYWKLPEDMRAIMLQLNLADDYFQEQERSAALEQELARIREEDRREMEAVRGQLNARLKASSDAAAKNLEETKEAYKRILDQERQAAARELEETRKKDRRAMDSALKEADDKMAAARKADQDRLEAVRRQMSSQLQAEKDGRKRETEALRQQLASIRQEYEKQLADLQAAHQAELAGERQSAEEQLAETRERLTKELTEQLRKNRTIDWNRKESSRAKMRVLVKRLLKKYKYPPEGQEQALLVVMEQCNKWADDEDNYVERKLYHVEEDHDVRNLIFNHLHLDPNVSNMQIQKEVIDRFGEKYPDMSLNDWRHIIEDYTSMVREAINRGDCKNATEIPLHYDMAAEPEE